MSKTNRSTLLSVVVAVAAGPLGTSATEAAGRLTTGASATSPVCTQPVWAEAGLSVAEGVVVPARATATVRNRPASTSALAPVSHPPASISVTATVPNLPALSLVTATVAQRPASTSAPTLAAAVAQECDVPAPCTPSTRLIKCVKDAWSAWEQCREDDHWWVRRLCDLGLAIDLAACATDTVKEIIVSRTPEAADGEELDLLTLRSTEIGGANTFQS